MDLTNLQLRDVVINARGAKTSACQTEKGEKVIFNLSDTPVYSPFGATTFGDEQQTRRTIEWSLNPEQRMFWDAFDAWAQTYIAKHSERLLKKQKTVEQVKECYKSPVT